MAKRKHTPWDIRITVEPLNEDNLDEQVLDHHAITLEVATPDELPAKISLDETIAGYRWTAGVLARLGLALHERIVDATRGHGCPFGDRCGLDLEQPDMPALLGSCAAPRLLITIPSGCDLEDWTETVQAHLETVLQHEQWQPSEEDYTAWAAT